MIPKRESPRAKGPEIRGEVHGEMNQRQRQDLEKICGEGIRFDCPMDRYTTFRVGGKAWALCLVREVETLAGIVTYLNREGIPSLVLGRGSNLLVRDGGFEGVMLTLAGELADVERQAGEEPVLVAGGGLGIGELLNYCRQAGLGGVEFLAGIPGTLGGAVSMNAGAWGQETASVVLDIETITPGGKKVRIDRSELDFGYRRLPLSEGTVIIRVRLALHRESPDRIGARVAEVLRERKQKQPLEYPSGGSVFRNPPNDHAGRLIEAVGLKGKRIGGAKISEQHANFIVNTGEAKAADILALMDLAKREVKQETGIELEPEIRVVGK